MFRKFAHSALAASLFVACQTPAVADDAEIYVMDTERVLSPPSVMFTLDLRSNLNSQVCNQATWAGCYALFLEAGMLPEFGLPPATDPTAVPARPDSVTFFQLLRAALRVVLAPITGINIGLMLNHENINNCQGQEQAGCSNGGYVAMGFRPLEVDTTEGGSDPVKDAFDALLKSIPPPQSNEYSNYSHTYQGRELFYEFSRYLRDSSVYNGWNGFTSYDGNLGSDIASGSRNISDEGELHPKNWLVEAEALSLAGKDAAAQILLEMEGFAPDPTATEPVGSRDYNGARVLGDCGQLYTINFLFQVSQQDADSNAEIEADLGLSQRGEFEQIIEYLNRTDLSPETDPDGKLGEQKVISYFFGDERFLSGPAGARKLDGYAQAGGTGYGRPLSTDPETLVGELNNIFSQILSVSTTFTAAALPVNSFDRAQLRGDVFLALFQPTTDTVDVIQPLNRYWWGNVKKLRLPGLNSPEASIELVDANGVRAIAADGRIERNRLTFWTNAPADDVQDTARDPDEFDVAGYDGRSVNRGGAGHRVPTFPQRTPLSAANVSDPPQSPYPRAVYYDTAGGAFSGSSLRVLDPGSAAVLSEVGGEFNGDHSVALDAETTKNLINYVRGFNPVTGEIMDWMMASVMHSRPLPINYGAINGHSRDNPLTYIAVGTNDGLFRFIRDTAGVESTVGKDRDVTVHLGREAWGFAPRAAMRSTGRIFLPGAPGPEHYRESTVYGVDGAPVAWLDDKDGDGSIEAGSGEKAYVFFGLRRGGKAYYALDVSEPESPRLLWAIDGEENPDFADLGLTFSDPAIGTVDLNGDGVLELVVIFGGGYDRRYDNEAAGPPADPLGNAIYVVNAETGELIKKLTHPDMVDSIAASVAAVDTNGDNALDRLYVGDLGGDVWRVDIPRPTDGSDATSSAWPVSLLASLGRHGSSDPADRRFFHKPDVVQAGSFYGPTGQLIWPEFDAVIITSGDRANPLNTSEPNYAFMLRDAAINPISQPLPSGSEIAMNDLTEINTVATVPQDADLGWKLELGAVGEKGLATPLTISNVIFFTTYVPPGAAEGDELVCGPAEGSGRVYRVSLFNANPLRDGPIDPWDDTPVSKWYDDLKSGGIPAEVVALPPNRVLRPDLDVEPVPITARWRTFWHLEEDPVE